MAFGDIDSDRQEEQRHHGKPVSNRIEQIESTASLGDVVGLDKNE